MDEVMEDEDNDEESKNMELSEFGFAPYFKFSGEKIDLIAEMHITKMTREQDEVLEEANYNYVGFSSELSFKLKFSRKTSGTLCKI
ncbi:MAG: hypothetical protein HC906_09285 [Bacteroidales bacterium]|nr:hypothetical protein [Bacteroidales bacterium]